METREETGSRVGRFPGAHLFPSARLPPLLHVLLPGALFIIREKRFGADGKTTFWRRAGEAEWGRREGSGSSGAACAGRERRVRRRAAGGERDKAEGAAARNCPLTPGAGTSFQNPWPASAKCGRQNRRPRKIIGVHKPDLQSHYRIAYDRVSA